MGNSQIVVKKYIDKYNNIKEQLHTIQIRRSKNSQEEGNEYFTILCVKILKEPLERIRIVGKKNITNINNEDDKQKIIEQSNNIYNNFKTLIFENKDTLNDDTDYNMLINYFSIIIYS